MRNSQLKPWLNEDGSVKSDAEIRGIGQQWPPKVWDTYLATVEVKRNKNCILSAIDMDNFSTEQDISTLFSVAREQDLPLFKVIINACIRELTSKQRDVVIRYFWDGKTIAEIAADRGVSKQVVRKTMKTALSKIKMNLVSGSFRRRVMAAKKMLAS